MTKGMCRALPILLPYNTLVTALQYARVDCLRKANSTDGGKRYHIASRDTRRS